MLSFEMFSIQGSRNMQKIAWEVCAVCVTCLFSMQIWLAR